MSEETKEEMMRQEAERAKEQMRQEEAEKKAKKESKAESKEESKAPEKEYKTEPFMFVRQTIKTSVSQSNSQGTNTKYHFAKENWVRIEKSPPGSPLSDEDYFLRKAAKNAHWETRIEQAIIYEQAFLVKFNGTKENPHSIELIGREDESIVERKTLISLKVGEWEKVKRKMYDMISTKAAGGTKIWEVKTENVPVEA